MNAECAAEVDEQVDPSGVRLSEASSLSKTPVCAVCGSKDSGELYQGLRRCGICTFVWADLNIDPLKMVELYGDNYFADGEYLNYRCEEAILKLNFEKSLRRIRQYANGGTLLEVGSAYGYFLDVARTYFAVSGIELNKSAATCAISRGHKVYQGGFLDVNLPDESFDVVVCLATLEHFPEPDRYIEKIARLVKPGGVFYFSTCDMGSWFARVSGRKWRVIHPPTHVSYWSVKTLTRILARFNLGVVECKRLWEYRSLASLLHLVGVRLRITLLQRLSKWHVLSRIPFPFNLGDAVFIAAVKPVVHRVAR